MALVYVSMQNIDNMIEIRIVKSKKEQREFVNFPIKLYKNNPYFVPPLYMDEMKMFKPNYVYNDQAKSIFFNAYQDGKMVGRIQGIIQYASNKKWNEKKVRFTRFDSIDNQEVADKLFEALENWARANQMEAIVGPLGYSDLEREGLLIEGFDELSTYEEQYNYPYYQKLIENLGYVKDVDWVERKLRAPEVIDERFERLCSLIMRRYHLKFGVAKNTNDFLKKYADQFFDILDQTYEHIYGTVPFTDGMKKMIIDNFKLIIDIKYVAVILDENDRVVCFGLGLPSIATAVQKCKGHLTPIGIIRLLYQIKHPKVLDLGLIGVLPEYQMKGVASVLIYGVLQMLKDGKLEYAETNLNLEYNLNIQNQWKVFDNVLHKRRRAFIKKIN